MARFARVVIPGVPHHVTQRGNRRQAVFFSDMDYEAYLGLLKEGCAKAGVEIWAYCLMPNHVHLVLVPSHEDGLRAALGETHRRYSQRINQRENWTGYLWQGRFASAPMDGHHVLASARYIELNPVRAKLTSKPESWPWSSAGAHLTGKDDGIVMVKPLLDMAPDWREFLEAGLSDDEHKAIQRSEKTGRPLGSADFIKRLEQQTGLTLAKAKPGPKGRG